MTEPTPADLRAEIAALEHMVFRAETRRMWTEIAETLLQIKLAQKRRELEAMTG
jgi:hypothetical protein